MSASGALRARLVEGVGVGRGPLAGAVRGVPDRLVLLLEQAGLWRRSRLEVVSDWGTEEVEVALHDLLDEDPDDELLQGFVVLLGAVRVPGQADRLAEARRRPEEWALASAKRACVASSSKASTSTSLALTVGRPAPPRGRNWPNRRAQLRASAAGPLALRDLDDADRRRCAERVATELVSLGFPSASGRTTAELTKQVLYLAGGIRAAPSG